MSISICTRREEVSVFINDVIRHADRHRDEFGFLSENAYRQIALQEKIHVAFESSKDSAVYAGHIIFGGSKLQGKIVQAYVSSPFRGQNIGKMLVESVLSQFKKRGYLSASARVAQDLEAANKFWQKLGFNTLKVVQGGKSAGRLINVRVRDLDVPSLLGLMTKQKSKVLPNLGIGVDTSSQAPSYSFDLNVIFDVVKERSRKKQAGAVFHLAFNNHIRLSVTDEFLAELKRVSAKFPEDQMLKLAQTLPRLPAPSDESEISQLLNELAKTIFPDQVRDGSVSIQDISDVRHIAMAIYHGATGFITSEKALLKASYDLWKKHGLEIVSPEELIEGHTDDDTSTPLVGGVASSGSQRLIITDYRATSKKELQSFFATQKVPQTESQRLLGRGRAWPDKNGLVVYENDTLVAVGLWDSFPNPRGLAELSLHIDTTTHSSALITEHLLETASGHLSSKSPVVMSLPITNQNSLVRKTSIEHGFRAVDTRISNPTSIQKISVGRPLTSSNWRLLAQKIEKISGVILPSSMPDRKSHNSALEVLSPAGNVVPLTTQEFETLASPVLILFRTRYCAIVPIKKSFADDLLGTSNQRSLLDQKEAALKRVRTYFCTPRAASVLKPGTAIAFYESGKDGGRSAAVALGRVVSSRIEFKDEFTIDVLKDGVLDEKMFSEIVKGKQVLSVSFDNIIRIPVPVPLERLRQIECADGSNLITARSISASNLEKLINDGWHDVDQ